MLTNKIKVNYNMKNIDADFDIFKVEKANKDYYRCNILDSAVFEFKAAAVQWVFGATALVLFRKGEVTEQQFKDSIRKEYKDVKIQKIDVLDSDECSANFYYENRLLAQLLMNSMRTPTHNGFTYHNLTGKLLYHDPSWIYKDKKTGEVKFIRFLEVAIAPGMYLNLDHKTFRRCDSESAGMYVMDPKTGEFRKKLKTDTNIVSYKQGSLSHNHFRINNIDMTDYAHFIKSKMGIMEQFLRDVKEKLPKYISIELAEREDVQTFNISNLEKKGISESEYGEMLRKRGVVIVDEIHSEKSNRIAEVLKHELHLHYDAEAVIGQLSKDAYNIRIIHNEEFYTENEISDPHNDDLKGYIVQHVTEEAENFEDSGKIAPAIKKIIQELIIKGDVRETYISIFDWKRLGSNKEWTFILRKKRKNNEGERAEHINLINKKAYYYYNYYRLKISRDGKLEFDTFCDASQEENAEWHKICSAYDFVEDKHRGIQNRVEGLLYSDIDNIHAILLTKEKTLPNINVLMEMLKETDPRGKVEKKILIEAIKEFKVKCPEHSEKIAEWNYKLSEAADIITKAEVKKILNMKLRAASSFNRFLHEKYGIWIYGELRNQEFESVYQISNLMNIKFEYNAEDYADGNALVYYVGNKSQRLSYPNACCMRKVISMGVDIEYEEMFPLMAVEFVRNSQYTVLPFPYKYLREYIAQSEE